MAISSVGTQDPTSQGGDSNSDSNLNPQGTNPPQYNQDNINTTDNINTDKPVKKDVDLNLNLSDGVKIDDVQIEENNNSSLNLENSSVDKDNNQQIDFQNITPPVSEDVKTEDIKVDDVKTEDLSMELPPVPSVEKDKERLQKEDKETAPDTSGLDLSAISQAKIQESEGTQNNGMLNLDDLGAMSATTPVQQAPEIIETPTMTDTLSTDVPEQTQNIQPVQQQPVVTPNITPRPIQRPEPMINTELNAAYSTDDNTNQQITQQKTSSSRKIISIVVLVILMLGGGFYIFKTMFPDKAQIFTGNSGNIDNTETIAQDDKIHLEIVSYDISDNITGITTNITGDRSFGEIPPAKTGNTEVLPEIDLAENDTMSVSTNMIPRISGLIHTAAEETGADTIAGDSFDPFAEIEDILDKENPNQNKIDILNDLLIIGQEYYNLGEMAEDATILKYSRVLVQKIPVDISILEIGTDINIDKIDQHILLFENYIKKLEALASTK